MSKWYNAVMNKIEARKEAFANEKPSAEDIAQRIKENAPTGAILEKWTKVTIECPVCGHQALDKFTGGADVSDGDINYTDFVYDCRVCGLNLTEEEYQTR